MGSTSAATSMGDARGAMRRTSLLETSQPMLRTLQQMPFHRDRPPEQQLHRFMGARSGRKYRYAHVLAQTVAIDRIPRPLHALLNHL